MTDEMSLQMFPENRYWRRRRDVEWQSVPQSGTVCTWQRQIVAFRGLEIGRAPPLLPRRCPFSAKSQKLCCDTTGGVSVKCILVCHTILTAYSCSCLCFGWNTIKTNAFAAARWCVCLSTWVAFSAVENFVCKLCVRKLCMQIMRA